MTPKQEGPQGKRNAPQGRARFFRGAPVLLGSRGFF